MKLLVCFNSDFDLKSLKSFTIGFGEKRIFFKMSNVKSVDEYKFKYKFKFIAIFIKLIEVTKYTFRLFLSDSILFSTPHPSFRIIKFFRPKVNLILYLRNIHFFSESQSLSDRLSRVNIKGGLNLLFNNYYADQYFVSGIVNYKFLLKKGVLPDLISQVGLHPTALDFSLSIKPNRIVVISQAWAAHGFIEEYETEKKVIKDLIVFLQKNFSNSLEIILKLHPREKMEDYREINCEILTKYVQAGNSDIIIGGLSSFFFENASDNFYPIFLVHKSSLKYYFEVLKEFDLPYCDSEEKIYNKILSYINNTDNASKEKNFILSNTVPLKYYHEV